MMSQSIFSSKQSKLVLLVSLISATFAVSPARAEDMGFLRGSVHTTDVLPSTSNPSLNRHHDIKNGDAFGGGKARSAAPSSELFDAPAGAFDSQQLVAPRPPFNLIAQDEGSLGQSMNGMPDTPMNGLYGMPTNGMAPLDSPQTARQGTLQPPQMADPNDPDAQMKLAWDEWHRRVAEAIFVRFDTLAQKAFAQSRPLGCQVVYTVSRDRQISNVRMTTRSSNIVFNSMVLLVLKSMNGNPILEFPAGSRRMTVDKLGDFTMNYGMQGFKHTIGDNETIRLHQQQQQMQQMMAEFAARGYR